MLDAFHVALKRKITEALETRKELAISATLSDFAAVRRNVGYCEALKDVLRICDEIQSKLSNSNPLKGDD